MRAATPAPVDKLEKNGKEGEREEDKEEGDLPAEKEKDKEKEKDEGREAEGKRTGDPEEVGNVKTGNNKQLNNIFSCDFSVQACHQSKSFFFVAFFCLFFKS